MALSLDENIRCGVVLLVRQGGFEVVLAGADGAAELEAHDVVKITDAYPELDYEDAYNIQDAIKARKVARGTKISGLKMGLTSSAKMKQMGVEDPIRGFLVDYFAVPDGGTVDTTKLIHPKVEAEVAFVLKDEDMLYVIHLTYKF